MYSSVETRAPSVERIWMGDSVTDPTIGHRTDPVLGADLVFTVADGECTVRLQGAVTTRKTYPHRAGCEYVGVRFHPGVQGLFTDLGPHEVKDDAAPVDRLGSLNLEVLSEAVCSEPSLKTRGSILARMTAELACWQPAAPVVTAALDLFGPGCGSLRVSAAADLLGLSERQLQRLFRRHIGVTPKHALRLLRIQRLLAHIADTDQHDLATMAAMGGYFDQAHMTNDVNRVLGTTPSTLVAETECQRMATKPSR